MTTTLRPLDGPERVGPRRVRRRTYAVCANGRAIGTLRLADQAPWGEPCGWIEGLWVMPSRRRRGHGSVAVLAAEEILRQWGCRLVVVVLAMPDHLGGDLARAGAELSWSGAARPDAAALAGGVLAGGALAGGGEEGGDAHEERDVGEGAQALFDGLGYVLVRRRLAKDLASGLGRPSVDAEPRRTARLRPMRPDEFGLWFRESGAEADPVPRRSAWTGPVAGPRTLLRVLKDGPAPVAAAWAETTGEERGRAAVIRGIEVDPSRRGRGYGGMALALTELVLAAGGASAAVLDLTREAFRFARACEHRGYEVVSCWLTKPLVW